MKTADLIAKTIKSLDKRDFAQQTPLLKDLTCCICYKLFQEPTTLRCGHTFCKGCLKYCLRFICPIDRTPFRFEELNKNIIISKIIEVMPLFCPGDFNLVQNDTPSHDHLNISYIESLLACAKCAKTLKNPITLPCGHTLCQSCMRGTLSTGCPVDGTKFGRFGKYSKDIVIAEISNIINQLKENPCSGSNTNGIQTLKLSNWNRHVETCWHVPITCDCGQQIKRESFFEITVACKCELTSCEYCDKKIPMRCNQKHQEICKFEVLDCRYCDEVFCRTEKDSHNERCRGKPRQTTKGRHNEKRRGKPQQTTKDHSEETHSICTIEDDDECYEPKVQKKVDKGDGKKSNNNALVMSFPHENVIVLDF